MLRGRTTVTIACYLTWIGAFPSTKEALDYVLSVQNAGIQQLIPSQERRGSDAAGFIGSC
jgi:hypothetical protein